MYPQVFNYYHLYSIPIFGQSQFKTIIPNNKYLLKNELYYTFQSDACNKIVPLYYICKKFDLQELKENNPCEIQLLDMKNTSSCQQVHVQITKPIFRQLEKSPQWIGIFPREEIINLKCQEQEEILKLTGTHLINIPIGCQITTSHKDKITNQEHTINSNQTIFFPQLDHKMESTPKLNWSIHLEDTKLDELQNIKQEIIKNQPQLLFSDGISHIPSIWTITLYIILVITVLYICYTKLTLTRCRKGKEERNQRVAVKLPNVQLPQCIPELNLRGEELSHHRT